MSRFVYFIESGAGGPIKIGIAVDVASRMRDLQAANPAPLNLIVAVPGDFQTERHLHKRFKNERLNNEWFSGSGAVRDFAMSLVGTPESVAVAAVAPDPRPAKQKRKGKHINPLYRYTSKELHALFHVADGESIYLSREAEDLVIEYAESRKAFGLDPEPIVIRR